MNNYFSQLYAEVGSSFDRLDGPLLQEIIDGLDALGLTIEKFATIFKKNDFSLVFILSAERALSSVKVMGPNIRRKACEVEFSLYLPWRATSNFIDEVKYVLPHISEGISIVLTRYGVDTSGIAPCMEQVLSAVLKDPKKYQFPNRPDNF